MPSAQIAASTPEKRDRRSVKSRKSAWRRVSSRGCVTASGRRLIAMTVVNRASCSASRTTSAPTTPVGPRTSSRMTAALVPIRADDFFVVFDIRRAGPGSRRAVGRLLATWTDIVPLDHLVQRRRLDVKELGGAFLHAARRFQRGFDQA